MQKKASVIITSIVTPPQSNRSAATMLSTPGARFDASSGKIHVIKRCMTSFKKMANCRFADGSVTFVVQLNYNEHPECQYCRAAGGADDSHDCHAVFSRQGIVMKTEQEKLVRKRANAFI